MKAALRVVILGPIFALGLLCMAPFIPLVAAIYWLLNEDPKEAFRFFAEAASVFSGMVVKGA